MFERRHTSRYEAVLGEVVTVICDVKIILQLIIIDATAKVSHVRFYPVERVSHTAKQFVFILTHLFAVLSETQKKSE